MNHVKTILIAAVLGLSFGIWKLFVQTEVNPSVANLPRCAPINGDAEIWKKNALVGSSQKQISDKFGAPDGIFKVPYRYVANSDETWVYHGTGILFNRTGKHIVVFSKGNCVAASDSFIYELSTQNL